MANAQRTLVERFWSHVEIRGPDDCWFWTGAVSGNGYPYFRVGGQVLRAARLMLTLQVGPATDDGMYALHSCDIKLCCNPSHLRWGTQSENVKDEWARFRREPRRIELVGVQADLIPLQRSASAN